MGVGRTYPGLACVAVLLAAGPGAALEPPPPCSYDVPTGRLVSSVGYEQTKVPVVVIEAGKDFVHWQVYVSIERGIGLMVLQHCPTGTDLAVVPPRAGGAAVVARWDEMVDGAARFTMQRMGAEMARMGAEARFGKNAYGTCGCDLVGA